MIDYLAHFYHLNTPVHYILHLTKGRQCFDHHDYVYGILGLLPSALQSMTRPSYELTVAETYTNLTISFLKHENSLALLRDCQPRAADAKHRLPSWVPDLSRTDHRTMPIEWQNAAGDSRAVFRVVDNQHLHVDGVQCAIVTRTEGAERSNDAQMRIKALFHLLGLREITDDQRTNTTLFEVFCRTLAGGFLRDRFPEETLPTLETWMTTVASQGYLERLFAIDPDEPTSQFHEQWVTRLLHARVFFQTDTGSMGLGPAEVAEGMHLRLKLTPRRTYPCPGG